TFAIHPQTRLTVTDDIDTVALVAASDSTSRIGGTHGGQRNGARNGARNGPGRSVAICVASHHTLGTAPKDTTTHPACAIGRGGDESLCQARVCQPGRKHQGPLRLLDPQTSGRAR